VQALYFCILGGCDSVLRIFIQDCKHYALLEYALLGLCFLASSNYCRGLNYLVLAVLEVVPLFIIEDTTSKEIAYDLLR